MIRELSKLTMALLFGLTTFAVFSSPAAAATIAYRTYHASSCWVDDSYGPNIVGPTEIVNPFQPDYGVIYHSLRLSVASTQYAKFVACPLINDSAVALGSNNAPPNGVNNVLRVVGYDNDANTWIGARLCRAYFLSDGGACSTTVASSFAATGNFNIHLDSAAWGWNNNDPSYILIEVDHATNQNATAQIRGYYMGWLDD